MKLFLGLSFCLFMSSCGIPYYGEVVGEDVKRYRQLHDYVMELESDYIVVLENLARSPNDAFLISERDRIGTELFKQKDDLKLYWDQKEKAIHDWEQALVKESAENLRADSLEDSARKRIQKQLRKNGVNLNIMD